MKRPRFHLTKSFRRDPGQTKRFIQDFEHKLVGRFEQVKEPILAALESSRLLEVKNPPTFIPPPPIDTPHFTRRIYEITGALYSSAAADTARTAANAYLRGSEFGSQTVRSIGIKAILPSEGGVIPADLNVIDAIQSRNLAALKGITDDMAKEIVRAVSDGIQQGDGITEIRRAITGRVDAIGKVRVQTLARTEVMNAWNTGAVNRYRQYGIEKVEWVTGTDENVCEECAPLDGKQWPISEAPQIPAHPNCRCVLIAVPEELPEEETAE